MQIESATNESRHAVRVTVKKEEDRASILAHCESKKVGSMELHRRDNDWLLDSCHIDGKYDNNGMIMSEMMSRLREIKNDGESLDKATQGLMVYLEKD